MKRSFFSLNQILNQREKEGIYRDFVCKRHPGGESKGPYRGRVRHDGDRDFCPDVGAGSFTAARGRGKDIYAPAGAGG